MKNISYEQYKNLVSSICRDIAKDEWDIDYVVGITRGGLLPAVMISHYFDVPCYTLKVSLRDMPDSETNCWMAEDAFGYSSEEINFSDENSLESIRKSRPKNILIVDDINDTGATFNWIIEDWKSGCFPKSEVWEDIWGTNVRFATIVNNLSSKCLITPTYSGMEINKAEQDVWIEFPYETWWK